MVKHKIVIMEDIRYKQIEELVEKYSNDFELGEQVRKLILINKNK